MITYALIENTQTGRYFVSASVDSLSPHWYSEDEYTTVDEAKSVHPHDWKEPDAECGPDVVAVAVENK